ncbi:hypothetical protein [Ligilactobacillus apodemi]|nr:hypothetical protein [Ligilactobacillus apodemi]MCR1900846.1 hypothetical protein [Ligilactobacillus apodemi]
MKLFEYQKGKFKMSASVRRTTKKEMITSAIALIVIAGLIAWWVMK